MNPLIVCSRAEGLSVLLDRAKERVRIVLSGNPDRAFERVQRPYDLGVQSDVNKSETEPLGWRGIIAVGVIAENFSPIAIAKFSGVDLVDVEAAFRRARDEGLVVDGAVSDTEGISLVAELPTEIVTAIHESVARELMSHGPGRLLEAVSHARSAASIELLGELADLSERAARTNLSFSDYSTALELLKMAEEVGFADPADRRARRLRDLAAAYGGLGRVPEARSILAQAFELAEFAGDSTLAANIAVRYAMPADWYAGDLLASALLHRAENLDLSNDERVAVVAARAVVEMRVPTLLQSDQQVDWVTRASIAQPLSESALLESESLSESTRLVALIGWRSTHRTPRLLTRRRELSSEALDLAQQLRSPGRQVDAGIMLMVDSLESSDRPLCDQAVAVVRWVAEKDGNPRLGWHAHTSAAGIAHMEGDLEVATRHRHRARELGQSIGFPGWFGADLLLHAQEAFARNDLEEMRRDTPADGGIEFVNPIAKVVVARIRALLGDPESAEDHLRRAMLRFDEEASFLVCASLATRVAVMLDVPDVVDELIRILTPWEEHVAVDSNAWWCEGPVALALADLELVKGNGVSAMRHLNVAEQTARRMGDVRSLGRVAELKLVVPKEFSVARLPIEFSDLFSEREVQVLRRLVAGASNPEIARDLSYSASTIRNEVASIYRKLDVRTRPAAAAKAISLGLV